MVKGVHWELRLLNGCPGLVWLKKTSQVAFKLNIFSEMLKDVEANSFGEISVMFLQIVE